MFHVEVTRRLYRNRVCQNRESRRRHPDFFPLPALSNAEATLIRPLRKDGLVVIRDFMSTEQVAGILAAVKEKIASKSDAEWRQVAAKHRDPNYKIDHKWGVPDPDGTLCWADDQLSDRRIYFAEKLHPSIATFANHDLFKHIAEAYLGRPVKLKFCLANHTRYVAENRGSGGGWHRDDTYAHGFKSLMYLVATDGCNGCFQYLPHSASIFHHLLKTPRLDDKEFTHSEVERMLGNSAPRIVDITGKPGTVAMFDTNCVHRGKPIEQGERFAITNYYDDL